MRDVPGPVEIRFISGYDPDADWKTPPPLADEAGLVRRFAVIQETCVEGSVDMVFDEAVWRALADYAARFCDGAAVSVMPWGHDRRGGEVPVARFLEDWETVDPDDRTPPQFLLARADGRLELCAMSELWAQAGGPKEYHDSYTYVLHSRRDLTMEVPAFLHARPEAGRWTLTPVMMESQTPLETPLMPKVLAPSFLRRLFRIGRTGR